MVKGQLCKKPKDAIVTFGRPYNSLSKDEVPNEKVQAGKNS